jgi:hypothetical protein
MASFIQYFREGKIAGPQAWTLFLEGKHAKSGLNEVIHL